MTTSSVLALVLSAQLASTLPLQPLESEPANELSTLEAMVVVLERTATAECSARAPPTEAVPIAPQDFEMCVAETISPNRAVLRPAQFALPPTAYERVRKSMEANLDVTGLDTRNPSVSFQTVTMGRGSILWRWSTGDWLENRHFFWFSTQASQSALFVYSRQLKMNALDKKFDGRGRLTKLRLRDDLALALISCDAFPAAGISGGEGDGGLLEAQGHDLDEHDYVRMCVWLLKKGLAGWRFPNNQNEVFICPSSDEGEYWEDGQHMPTLGRLTADGNAKIRRNMEARLEVVHVFQLQLLKPSPHSTQETAKNAFGLVKALTGKWSLLKALRGRKLQLSGPKLDTLFPSDLAATVFRTGMVGKAKYLVSDGPGRGTRIWFQAKPNSKSAMQTRVGLGTGDVTPFVERIVVKQPEEEEGEVDGEEALGTVKEGTGVLG